MTSAADLFALQEVDLKRDARRAIIADIESRTRETEELLAAREAVTNAEAELERVRREQRDLENEISDLDAKIQPLEEKLYGGSVRNAKELSDMQKEFESFKAKRSPLDDAGLAMMETMEAANAAVKQAQAEAKDAESYWLAGQENLAADKKRAEADMARLDEDRELRLRDMDTSAIGLYESLRKTKNGRAVAMVERGTCQGCRISLPSHLVQRMRAGHTVQCVSCERILVAG